MRTDEMSAPLWSLGSREENADWMGMHASLLCPSAALWRSPTLHWDGRRTSLHIARMGRCAYRAVWLSCKGFHAINRSREDPLLTRVFLCSRKPWRDGELTAQPGSTWAEQITQCSYPGTCSMSHKMSFWGSALSFSCCASPPCSSALSQLLC